MCFPATVPSNSLFEQVDKSWVNFKASGKVAEKKKFPMLERLTNVLSKSEEEKH